MAVISPHVACVSTYGETGEWFPSSSEEHFPQSSVAVEVVGRGDVLITHDGNRLRRELVVNVCHGHNAHRHAEVFRSSELEGEIVEAGVARILLQLIHLVVAVLQREPEFEERCEGVNFRVRSRVGNVYLLFVAKSLSHASHAFVESERPFGHDAESVSGVW